MAISGDSLLQSMPKQTIPIPIHASHMTIINFNDQSALGARVRHVGFWESIS